MLRLVNDTAYLTTSRIRAMFSAYPQIVFDDADDIPLVTDAEGTFPADPEGVYITDMPDAVHGYAGATYIFGAVTVYDVGGTLRRLGGRFGRRVILLRILHEILHHYALDADRIDDWFVTGNHPVLALLYHVCARSSGETWIGAAIQEQFYRHLLAAIDIPAVERAARIPERTYQGLLHP